MSNLAAFAADLASGRIKVIDLTQTLSADFPTIALPPEFGQCAPFRLEEISRYDNRGPAWYWNNFSCGEHTGTHFDAPIHWVSGKDFPNNTTDTIPAKNFIAPACVIDCSRESSANADFILTVDVIKAWEAKHGRIPAGSWVLLRTDWSKRSGAAQAASLALAQSLRHELRPLRVINALVGPLDDEWHQAVPPPKVSPAALAAAVVRALRDGLEDIAVGEVAMDLWSRWKENPTTLARELAAG